MNIYTGIGSRETPAEIQELMVRLAHRMGLLGWTLRSGAAEGADKAFEAGCDQARGLKEIYLPWCGFNNNSSQRYRISPEALELAATLHPAWVCLGQGPQKLHARNCYQILGQRLDTPSRAVICWTKDGCESTRQRSRLTGGTATAIVLAEARGVPVLNLRNDASHKRIVDWLGSFDIDVEAIGAVGAPRCEQGALF